jgi:hypothetical protein
LRRGSTLVEEEGGIVAGQASVKGPLRAQWNRYSAAALSLLKGNEKEAALDRLKQHQAQMRAVAG